MTYEVRTTITTLCPIMRTLAMPALVVETLAEAEAWFECRLAQRHLHRVVHTLFGERGEVLRVVFA